MNEEMNKCGTETCVNGVCTPKSACKCPHHLTGPVVIIAIGVIMLLSVLGVLQGVGVGVALSVIIIVLGVMMALKRTCRCCCSKR